MMEIEVRDVDGLGVATLLVWDNGEISLRAPYVDGDLGLTPETARKLRDALDKALALKGFIVSSGNQEKAAVAQKIPMLCPNCGAAWEGQ